MTTIASEDTSENDSTGAVRDTAPGSKNRTITGTIKGLFRDAVNALTRRDEDEPQPPRRRRGETEGDFRMLARKAARRFDARTQFRKVAAACAPRHVRTIFLSPEEWGGPDAHLSTALDLLAHVNNDAAGSGYGGGFDTSQNHISPRL
jgi:hypothetical protein